MRFNSHNISSRKPRKRFPSWRSGSFDLLEDRFAMDGGPSDGSDSTSSSIFAQQSASLSDREILATGHEAFQAATAVPSISPALPHAIEGDLVVTESSMLDPAAPVVTAVVLKPRASQLVYEIPQPSVNDNHYEFLRDHLQAAKDAGAGTIRFPKAFTFQLKPPVPFESQPTGPLAQKAHLNLSGLHDTIIDLNKSTLVLLDKVLGIRIEDSQRIVLRNGTIRGSELLSTIATVREDTSSEAGIKLDVLPEFETLLEASATDGLPNLKTVGSVERGPDGRWRIKAEGYGELFTNRGLEHNNFSYVDGEFIARSKLVNDEIPFSIDQNVWLLHESNNAHGLYLDNRFGGGVEDVTLERLTFENIAGMVVVGDVDRGLHIDRMTIATGPNSLGLYGASSDGIHINANGGDIVIENSWLGPNGDDKITIKGNYWRVTELDATTKTLTVEPIDENISISRWGRDQDRVVFIDRSYGLLGEAKLFGDSVMPKQSGNLHHITLDQIPAGIGVRSIIGNVDRSGGRVFIRNNRLSETRAQGILVQTSHVVIENNYFEGMGGPAISVELALEDWYEAINTNNVRINLNAFTRTSKSLNKSNDLIEIHQVDSMDNPIDLIDHVKISGNFVFEANMDVAAPRVTSIKRLSANPDSEDEVEFQVQFSESVSGVSANEFVIDQRGLGRASITSVKGRDDTYTIRVQTGGGKGTLSLDFKPTVRQRVLDRVGNRAIEAYTEGEVYDIGQQDNATKSGVELIYLNKTPEVMAAVIEVQLDLVNTDTQRTNYRDMEIRYYLDADGLRPEVSIISSSEPIENLSATFDDDGRFLSIRILKDTWIDAGERLKVRFQISNRQGEPFNQSNDASFDPAFKTKGPSDKIHVYLEGKQIWGEGTDQAQTSGPPRFDRLQDDDPPEGDFKTHDRSLVISGTWDELHSLAFGVYLDSILYLYGFHPELQSDGQGRWELDLTDQQLDLGIHALTAVTADTLGDVHYAMQAIEIL